ncbi:MAG TPA: hypothetical protein DIT76_04305 [Spartobacteria bacterium]|nr:hypothetical protein [Spartobacteria bacterium]
MLRMAQLFASLLLFASLCSCNKPLSETEKEERAQEEAAKIAAERERLAALQQEQREKVAGDLSTRSETREARRAANMERAAAEQARRDGIVAEVKAFVDDIWMDRSVLNDIRILRVNGRPTKPGSVFASPAGYSVTFTKEEGDYFWFAYDEDAFSLTLRKPSVGLSIAEIKPKLRLADGFEVGQTLPDVSSDVPRATSPFTRGLLVLKATYGAGQTQRDVKDLVKSKIQNGRLDFRAHNGELGGDPIFGQVKTFYIKYVSNGRMVEKSFREGEHVSLP